MIERTRYVEDFDGNRFGVISLIYDKGNFGLGISLCRPTPDKDGNVDKFDKETGVRLAKERALKSLETDHYLLKDFLFTGRSTIDFSKYNISLPEFNYRNLASSIRSSCLEMDFLRICEDMIYTLALTKVREDSRKNS